ncbi:chromate transporter [Myroides sp. LJL119]
MIFLQLIWVFFKIGLFGFGGGYAMLSLIQQEVVEKNKWISSEEFIDLIAISQTTPGPIGINSATYVGFKAVQQAGYPPIICFFAGLICTIAVCLPAFTLILFISYWLIRYKTNTYVQTILQIIGPLSLALISFAAYNLMTPNNFIDYSSILFFLLTLILSVKYKLHPVKVIFIISVLGIIVY